jgi:hypothetical protein
MLDFYFFSKDQKKTNFSSHLRQGKFPNDTESPLKLDLESNDLTTNQHF